MRKSQSFQRQKPQSQHIVRKDGARLVIPPHIIAHMVAHPDVTSDLLLEAFETLNLSNFGSEIRVCVEFDRIIGTTSKIETEEILPADTGEFAFRIDRKYPSRTVVGGSCPPTRELSIIAERKSPDLFILRMAFTGTLSPPEPFSLNMIRKMGLRNDDVVRFWCRHALVYDAKTFSSDPFESSWEEIVAQAEADQEAGRQERVA